MTPQTPEMTDATETTTFQFVSTEVTKQLSKDTILLLNIANGFWRYGSIILLAIGTLGNLLSFIVMMTKQLRGSVTSVYLAVLAVADTMVLYTGLLRQWVRVVFSYDVRLVSSFGCRFHVFLVYFTIWFAIWLLVLVSIERFVNVFFPHSAKQLFTRRTAITSIIGLFFSDLIIHIFFFWVLEIRKTPNGEICDFYHPEGHLGLQVRKLWPPINIVLAFWLPSVLVLIFNVSIMFKLRCHRRTSTVAPLGHAGGVSTQPRVSSMTLTLLGVAFAFLLAVTPMALYLALEYKWEDPDDHFEAQLSLWWALANWLMYCNSSMNFFLYVLAGPRFRRRLREMICPRKNACFPGNTIRDVSMASQYDGSSTSNRRQSMHPGVSGSDMQTAMSHIQNSPAMGSSSNNTNQLHPSSCLQPHRSRNGVSKRRIGPQKNIQADNGSGRPWQLDSKALMKSKSHLSVSQT